MNKINKLIIVIICIMSIAINLNVTSVKAHSVNVDTTNIDAKGPLRSFIERSNSPIKLPNKGYIALTFDDGPYAPTTNILLDKLKEYNVKATFFMLGSRVEKYAETVKRVYAEGHQVGNHSYSHKNLTKVDEHQFNIEVNQTNDMIQKITGEKPSVIRPPYGANNDIINKKIDMPIINWNVDTMDWKNKNSKMLKDHVLNNLKDGNIILMHDIHKTTIDGIIDIIDDIHNMGYRMVTITELAKIKGETLENGKVYNHIK